MKECTPITITLIKLGKRCLISSLNKWVIDYGTIDHITGNHDIFFSFRLHKKSSPETIFDGSTYNIVGSGTIKLTLSIILLSILSISKLTFNLIFMSRFTKDLKCYIQFFYDLFFLFRILWRNKLLVKEMYRMVTTFFIPRCLD